MNRRIHLLLILGCIVIAALDAPRASRLFSEGLAGPYDERAALSEDAAPALPPAPIEMEPALEGELPARGPLLDSLVLVPEEGEK